MINQDYLSVIRETEEKAEAIIAEAQAESRRQLEQARAEAERRIEAARLEVEALLQQMLQETTRQSQKISSDQLASAADEARLICDTAAPAMPEAVKAVAERIVR